MTIDERLERLTERHESHSQMVEVMAGIHQENERRLARVMESMNRLINIVASHEDRLDDHEHRLDKLEGQ